MDGIMSDYKGVFEEAKALANTVDYKSYFPDFHNHPELFHFIVAPQHLLNTDGGALEQAKKINYDIYARLFLKGPSKIGGGSEQLDAIESRHILLMTNLINTVGIKWGNVLEIGGGYGNWLRLASGIVDYITWTIVDMPYILELQKWFLQESDIPLSNAYFTQDSTRVPTLVIGTHSLSEFSLDDFLHYYETIRKAKWFFYATQPNLPDIDLVQKKLAIIGADFYTRDFKEYESGNSRMYLFEQKYD